jgi:Protein of unknown function (DUF1592)/Protein of unknown function (DUF1588)/Protein of unknown function (DUF1595)/Protein of unknown function (DUF1585)/Protein of unknown function (DUF1587)
MNSPERPNTSERPNRLEPRRWSRKSLFVLASLLIAGVAAGMVLKSHRPEAAPGRAVTRLLTADQYRNIVADVFGDDIDLGGRLEPDLRADGLLAVGATQVSIAPAGMEQYDAMARAVANQILDAKHREGVLPCRPAGATAFDEQCARAFLTKAGRLLYRRPLNQAELDAYVKAARIGTEQSGNFYDGVGLSVAGMLSSPKFLFREETLEPDPDHKGRLRLDAYSRASQLSFFLWNSAPDGILLDAAAGGDLNSKRGLARQVDRMMASPRLEEGIRAFFVDDFRFDEFETLAKDAMLFPKFGATVAAEAREQTLRTILDVVLTRDADYREIFTTKKTFMTPELGSIYQVPIFAEGPNGAPDEWQPYEFPASDPRGGILTQVAFTALHSPAGRSSPTIRGKALREIMLCQSVPSPPGDVDFSKFELASARGDSTARVRLSVHASVPTCAGCHKIMDPLGLSLEHFDGAGEFRTADHGAPIDASGTLDNVSYTDSSGLAQAVAQNPATSSCLVERLTARALGRTTASSERIWVSQLKKSFAGDGYRMKKLMQEIAYSDALYRASMPTESSGRSGAFATIAIPDPLLSSNQEPPK